MIVIGIDPGKTGAIAVLAHSTHYLLSRHIYDMPLTAKKVDPVMVGEIFHEIAACIGDKLVVIEGQQAYPKQGVSTSFEIGRNFGIVLGAVGAMGWPWELVSPAKWKRVLGVPKDKDGARARASQIMPTAADAWRLKKHDGRAEAALIAHYGARYLAPPSAPHSAHDGLALAPRSSS